MNTKTLSERGLSVIDQYLRFKVGGAVCSVPYFNNRTVKARAALRTYIGKGSPADIFEETNSLAVKEHIDPAALSDESLKKLLVDNNLGIECSGFAYYVLSAESHERGKGALERHISFVNCSGIVGKIRCSLRPAENCDVATFAHDKNSRVIGAADVAPGDIITMAGGPDGVDRDHILVIYQVEYQNFVPIRIHYSHAVAYPEDGLYGSGVRQGSIEITDPSKPLTDAVWSEGGSVAAAAHIFARAQISKTELRRLLWFL